MVYCGKFLNVVLLRTRDGHRGGGVEAESSSSTLCTDDTGIRIRQSGYTIRASAAFWRKVMNQESVKCIIRYQCISDSGVL
jgi:hypothetical protein